jgi:Nuclease-related domain
MAYDVDRKPGSFAKRRETAHSRVAFIFLALVLVAIVLSAVLLLTGTSGVIASGALLFVAFAARHFFEPHLADATRWGKGGNGEVAVGAELDALLAEGYVVMHDLDKLVAGNVDHFVSGPTGSFMIETKFKSYQDRDVAKAKRVAKAIAREVGTTWVQPVICLATREYGPRTVGRVVVIVGREQLLPYLRATKNVVAPFAQLAAFADRQ